MKTIELTAAQMKDRFDILKDARQDMPVKIGAIAVEDFFVTEQGRTFLLEGNELIDNKKLSRVVFEAQDALRTLKVKITSPVTNPVDWHIEECFYGYSAAMEWLAENYR